MLRLCSTLEVSPSGYYDWCDRPLSKTAKDNQRLKTKIRCYHRSSRGIYGSPRIQHDLLNDGEQVSRQRVARLMKEEGIESKMVKKFVVTTNSKRTTSPAPDRLQRRFEQKKINQAWVSDTTFIRTRQGWLYLAVMIDLYSRQVIGWSMSDRNDTKLVSDALMMAKWRRGDLHDVIVHSDQGSTYASSGYRKLLNDNNMLCSMSRKGECHDNAVAESFFGTLKTELVDHEDYRTRIEAKQSLFEYIEVFYNRQRRHSYLGYVSPVEYEQASAL
ncbi:transposase [Candidatus Endobugula sertula]|uniref:Transposase n=1 Tax=Candidatus Endobugula sertula TaxID=62101 RepID=A0A1D2QRB3_9GAMM|nr:transposase [Candidatus Endobugula sertula]